ncbi:hypothetical protein AB0M95_16230 [Sphaerisporangium sp. NPDC051017]|uniref:hypothetical protein n=1 Tax=Sphaerisporangium sp. NPDC051017 TaxID=3154636 RepID=UPI0034485C37
MVHIAISGHRGLGAATSKLVEDAIVHALTERSDVTGVSCLADGADQIFARAVVDRRGALEVVVPAQKYREGLPAEAHAEYDALMKKARTAHRLNFVESTSESHMEASKLMLDLADELYAVWDGQPARGYGGTADVVAEARSRGIRVRVIWPEGAQRD